MKDLQGASVAMTKEIFQFKPNFYGIGVDLNAAYSRWKEGRGGRSEVTTVAKRFLTVFSEHGVLPGSIPRLIPSLRYSDLLDETALLAALTPETLDRTSTLFGVRMAWLTAADDMAYEPDYSYKSPSRLQGRLAKITRDAHNMPLRAISTSRYLDRHSTRAQRLELVVVEPVATVDETTIYRFHPFADGWEWRYAECRIQLKAMVRALRRPVPLYEVTEAEMELAYRGALFYGSVLRGALLTEPSLEDYAMTAAENRHSKEVDELPEVRIYMRENGLGRPRHQS